MNNPPAQVSSTSYNNDSQNDDGSNGLILNGVLLPEEVLLMLLSYTSTKSILKCRLVCKAWNEYIKSDHFWRLKLRQLNKKNAKKKLPWYAYYCYIRNDFFDKNLLRNGCGEKKFKYWKIIHNGGNQWAVEESPMGADPLPTHPDFQGKLSCFATSFESCNKYQRVSLKNNELGRKILDELQPTIRISEWYAGRFDCGCEYMLRLRLYNSKKKVVFEKEVQRRVIQWDGSKWEKVEITCENYGKDVTDIEFYHVGRDTQFWAGHYGSKMAGGVVEILFDSL